MIISAIITQTIDLLKGNKRWEAMCFCLLARRCAAIEENVAALEALPFTNCFE
jgi:hypothetical protein